jgi:hypothetical protein
VAANEAFVGFRCAVFLGSPKFFHWSLVALLVASVARVAAVEPTTDSTVADELKQLNDRTIINTQVSLNSEWNQFKDGAEKAVNDASVYDMSSGNQTAREGEFVVFRNDVGHYAVAHVVDVKARSNGDSYDALILEYWINPDGSPRFAE